MIVTKRKLEKLIATEVARYIDNQQHKIIYEVEVGDMPKPEVETYLEKIKEKLTNELHLKEDSFMVVSVRNGVGHVNLTYIC